jgi:hypothetical protein
MALRTAWSSSRVILVSTSRPYPSTLRVQEPLSIRFLPCIAVIERLFPVPTRDACCISPWKDCPWTTTALQIQDTRHFSVTLSRGRHLTCRLYYLGT